VQYKEEEVDHLLISSSPLQYSTHVHYQWDTVVKMEGRVVQVTSSSLCVSSSSWSSSIIPRILPQVPKTHWSLLRCLWALPDTKQKKGGRISVHNCQDLHHTPVNSSVEPTQQVGWNTRQSS